MIIEHTGILKTIKSVKTAWSSLSYLIISEESTADDLTLNVGLFSPSKNAAANTPTCIFLFNLKPHYVVGYQEGIYQVVIFMCNEYAKNKNSCLLPYITIPPLTPVASQFKPALWHPSLILTKVAALKQCNSLSSIFPYVHFCLPTRQK